MENLGFNALFGGIYLNGWFAGFVIFPERKYAFVKG